MLILSLCRPRRLVYRRRARRRRSDDTHRDTFKINPFFCFFFRVVLSATHTTQLTLNFFLKKNKKKML